MEKGKQLSRLNGFSSKGLLSPLGSWVPGPVDSFYKDSLLLKSVKNQLANAKVNISLVTEFSIVWVQVSDYLHLQYKSTN